MSNSGDDPVLRILARGKSHVVVDKPAGLLTTAPPGIASVQNLVRRQLADQTDYVVAVHRLDRDVGGVLLLATTKKAARLLAQQFLARRVEKVYRATVHGPVTGLPRWVDRIKKSDAGAIAALDRGGREAITDVTADALELTLRPRTGRMHQLRVQSAAHAGGIVGDRLYGGGGAGPLRLRAVAIRFADPVNGRAVEVVDRTEGMNPTDALPGANLPG